MNTRDDNEWVSTAKIMNNYDQNNETKRKQMKTMKLHKHK